MKMNIRRFNWLRKLVYIWRGIEECHSYTKGKGNHVCLKGVKVSSHIQIDGNENRIICEKDSLLKDTTIKVKGNKNTITLREGCYVSGAEIWVADNDCKVEIGERTFVGHHTHLACVEDNSELIIGSDGMLSSYIQVRTSDSHHILDMDGNRINPAQSVYIGDHVWIGQGVRVMKGVRLEGDDIVSTGAIVTKSFDKNVLIGGIPAKVLKEGVTWKS